MVHLYFIPYDGFSCYNLYGNGILAEYKKIYTFCKAQSYKISIVISAKKHTPGLIILDLNLIRFVKPANLAQLVEQHPRNVQVVGSSPIVGSIFLYINRL